MSSFEDFILRKNCPVAPYTLQSLFNVTLDELDNAEKNSRFVIKTKLGYFIHVYVKLVDDVLKMLDSQWAVSLNGLDDFATTSEFKQYIKSNADKLFMFKLDKDLWLKKSTAYNIYNIASMEKTAESFGFAGLNLEEIYAEYDNAFEDVEELIKTQKLIATKTRVYSALVAKQ